MSGAKAIITALVLICLMFVLCLFLIKFGWSLFMVPVFSLPELTWVQTFGLLLLMNAFKSTTKISNKNS